MKNQDTPPLQSELVEIQFTETIPDVSWYRHILWPDGQLKRFRHFHTMSQNANEAGFKFYNEIKP